MQLSSVCQEQKPSGETLTGGVETYIEKKKSKLA